MRKLVTAALAATLAPIAVAQADQLLDRARIDAASRVVLPGGPTLGLWQGGKYTATPDVMTIKGSAFTATNDYNDAGTGNTRMLGTIGTGTAPTTDKSAVGIWQKTSNYNTAGVNATTYASHVKMGAGGANEASAVFGEGIDLVGGAQSSILGGRFHAQLNGGSLGSPIGASAYATLVPGITSFQNAVGFEAAIENLFVDAPKVYSQATMTAAYLAGNTGTKRADAAYIVNPFATVPFRNALLVPAGSVSDAIVRTFATTEYGIDLAGGSQTVAAMKVPSSLEKQAPTLDNSGTAGKLIAAGASALLGAGSGGLWIVTNVTTQATGVYAGDAATGLAFLGGSPSWVAPTRTPAVGQMSIALDNDGLRIFNGPSPSGGNAAALFTSVTIKTR